jgi:hypothetical protein
MTREWGPRMDTKSKTANGHELTRIEDLTADGRGCTQMTASSWSLRPCGEEMNSREKAQKAQKRFTTRSVPGVHARTPSFAAFSSAGRLRCSFSENYK